MHAAACYAWLKDALPTWPQELASLLQTLRAEGPRAAATEIAYGLERRQSNTHRDTEAHWFRAPPGLTNAQVALASVCVCTVPEQRSSSGSTVVACLPAVHNTTA